MPKEARANGLWHGPDPSALSELSYCECKVINLARIYVSVKRIFLDRASYARTRKKETPLYHQYNVVAYPQNPDAALTALGMAPHNLAKMLTVQFVGTDRQALRHEPDLCVSVKKLRNAFRWLSMNSWPFMEATKHHSLWETDVLDDSLEELLQAYVQSIGKDDPGVPKELIEGASRIMAEHAAVHAKGPANCTPSTEDLFESPAHVAESLRPPSSVESQWPNQTMDPELSDAEGNQCAAVLDGGTDECLDAQTHFEHLWTF